LPEKIPKGYTSENEMVHFASDVFQLVGEDPMDRPDDGRALIATDPAGGSNRFS
jgi:hypothetical protein